jgi:hypothetical protein
MTKTLLEALSSAISSQASHSIPHVSGPVSSLALHYGLDWAGDETYKHLKKHPRLHHAYDKAFRSRNPHGRPGKFASDLASLGGTAAGIHTAEKLVKSGGMKAALAKVALGVAGHSAGRLVGNKIGTKLNRMIFVRRKDKGAK